LPLQPIASQPESRAFTHVRSRQCGCTWRVSDSFDLTEAMHFEHALSIPRKCNPVRCTQQMQNFFIEGLACPGPGYACPSFTHRCCIPMSIPIPCLCTYPYLSPYPCYDFSTKHSRREPSGGFVCFCLQIFSSSFVSDRAKCLSPCGLITGTAPCRELKGSMVFEMGRVGAVNFTHGMDGKGPDGWLCRSGWRWLCGRAQLSQ
jgi:hypothetical protein